MTCNGLHKSPIAISHSCIVPVTMAALAAIADHQVSLGDILLRRSLLRKYSYSGRRSSVDPLRNAPCWKRSLVSARLGSARNARLRAVSVNCYVRTRPFRARRTYSPTWWRDRRYLREVLHSPPLPFLLLSLPPSPAEKDASRVAPRGRKVGRGGSLSDRRKNRRTETHTRGRGKQRRKRRFVHMRIARVRFSTQKHGRKHIGCAI